MAPKNCKQRGNATARCIRHAIAFAALTLTAPLALAQTGQQTGQSAPSNAADAKPTTPGPQSPDAKSEEKQAAADVGQLFDDRGVLTPRNSLIFEPSLELSLSSSNRVAIEAFTIVPAIAIGLIDVREVRRESLTAAATFRYGITSRFEFETRIPYVYRRDEVRQRQLLEASSSDVITNSSGNGIGDIEAALHYQLNIPQGAGAYYIGNLRVKSRTGKDAFETDRELVTQDDLVVGERMTEQPTGSGFWAVEPSLTVVYPSDPAVFFGNLSYTWNIKRDVNDDIGTVDPGDFVGFSFGMGFGVNKNTSFSLGYDHTIVFETEQEGIDDRSEFDRIHVGSLLIGFNQQVTRDTNLSFSLAIGVTEDSPDLQLTLRAPITLF